MSSPFHIAGPALVSFSGGRTSGYMLWRILQAHGGTLPDDVGVTFANTGKEMPQTLDFVRDCGERWGVDITWLEYRAEPEATRDRWTRVTYETASRAGEPFAALTAKRSALPNPVARFCTQVLKIHTMRNYAWSLGWEDWTTVLGLRADEPRRVARLADNHEDGSTRVAPLAKAGVTRRDVAAFWRRQNFDLHLPNINGATPHGNCDLCFLKGAATISGIMRNEPWRAGWWIGQERNGYGKRGNATFRSDRPGYAAMLKAVQDQDAFDFGDRDEITDCFCGDAA